MTAQALAQKRKHEREQIALKREAFKLRTDMRLAALETEFEDLKRQLAGLQGRFPTVALKTLPGCPGIIDEPVGRRIYERALSR